METQRNKFNRESQPKGGKDSTKFVLTGAGAVAVGTGATIAANEWNNDEPGKEPETENLTDQVQTQETVEGNNTQTTQTTHPTQQPSTGNGTQQGQQEIQPVDNGQTIGQQGNEQSVTPQENGQTTVQGGNGETGQNLVQEEPGKEDQPYDPNIDDVNPDLIAQEITATEVDPNDIDVPDVVLIDDLDTMFFEDGSQMVVAQVHDSIDNEQYLMVDIDEDLTFDLIVDLEGNPISAVDGNLTVSDVLDMFDETGNELAYDPQYDEVELAGGENPDQDFINTENYNELAMTDTHSIEQLSVVTPVDDNDNSNGTDDDEDFDEEDLAELDEETSEDDLMIDELDA